MMISRVRRLGFVVTLLGLMVGAAGQAEAAVTLRFTNAEVNLGTGTQIPLTNEYSAYGVTFSNVYRYIDGRDPFSDAPDQVSGQNLGIANGFGGQLGTVSFAGTTPYITFDWWTINSPVNVFAYDASDNLVGSFTSGLGSGTNTIVGSAAIAYFQFRDNTGFAPIANLTYDLGAAPIPEPSTLAAGGIAIFVGLATSWRRRRRAA